MSQDDYLKELASQARDKTNTAPMAFGRGAYQGVTLDFGDELEARFLSMVKPDSSYKKELDRIHGQIDSYKRTHPKTMLGGEITGGATSLLAPLGIGGRMLKGAGALVKGGALTLEGATLGALQAYGQARDKGDSLDQVLNGALLGAIFVPLGGFVGALGGNIATPFFKYIDKNLGGQEAKAVVNALRNYARDKRMTLNDALKTIIKEKIPLMDIDPSFAHLGKVIATNWEKSGGEIIREGAEANLKAQSKSIQKQANQDLIPEGLVSPDQMNGYNNFLDTFEEMVSTQAEKTSKKYDEALSPSTQGIKAVPSEDLIQAFNNMIEVNPQFLKRANQLIRARLNLSYNPLKINKKSGKLENLTGRKLTMDIIETVAQDVKDLTYKMKSSKTARDIRKNQQEPVTNIINEEIPSIVDARSANTATQIAKEVEKDIRGVLSRTSPDAFLSSYKKNLAKITNKADKEFLTQQYRIGLAREIRDSMNTVKGLNNLIDNFAKSDSSASMIFKELYPNKSIQTMIKKFENAKNALTSKRIVAKNSDTEPNKQALKNANVDDAMTIGQSLRTGGLEAGAFQVARKLANHFRTEGYSEKDAIRLANILTSRSAGNAQENYRSIISRPELFESLFENVGRAGGQSSILETVADEPNSGLAQSSRGLVDQMIRMMR